MKEINKNIILAQLLGWVVEPEPTMSSDKVIMLVARKGKSILGRRTVEKNNPDYEELYEMATNELYLAICQPNLGVAGKYLHSWDALMEVVSLIENLGYTFNWYYNEKTLAHTVVIEAMSNNPIKIYVYCEYDHRIKSTYEACVLFAQAYNNLSL